MMPKPMSELPESQVNLRSIRVVVHLSRIRVGVGHNSAVGNGNGEPGFGTLPYFFNQLLEGRAARRSKPARSGFANKDGPHLEIGACTFDVEATERTRCE